MDGSHTKDSIPLEPEAYRRLKQNIAVHFSQLLLL